MKNRTFLFDVLWANVAVFVIIALFGLISLNLHVFDPVSNALADFKYSDMLYSKFRHTSQPDTNIILVNIGNLSREEIAQQINVLNEYQPRLIALDAYFLHEKEHHGDSLLREAIANTSDIVLAGILQQQDKDSHHGNEHHEGGMVFHQSGDFLGEHNAGYANFYGDNPKTSTIRYFEPQQEIGGHAEEAFITEVIKHLDKERYNKLVSKHRVTIQYSCELDDFISFDSKEVYQGNERLSIIKNKIIVMGFLGEPYRSEKSIEDKYFTPFNQKHAGRSFPDMYGVVIQSNILKMVLDDNYLKKTPAWVNWLIAFVLCYLHLLIFAYYYLKPHLWFHIIVKLTQLISSVIIMYIVLLLNFKLNIEFNVVPALAAIILSVDILYFYDAILIFLHKKFNVKTRFTGSH